MRRFRYKLHDRLYRAEKMGRLSFMEAFELRQIQLNNSSRQRWDIRVLEVLMDRAGWF